MKARRNQFSPSRLCCREAEKIGIVEWIETVPIPVAQAQGYVPATLRRLDLLPPFPKKFDYLTAHRFFMHNREGTKTKIAYASSCSRGRAHNGRCCRRG
jgi:hypothetical protein